MNSFADNENNVLPVWQNRVIIDVDAFAHNVSSIKSHIGGRAELVTVVKDDCYGHGASVLAPVALQNGADVLAVVNIDEARALRTSGVQAPILILGITGPYRIDEIPRWNLATVITDIGLAGLLQKAAAKRDVRVPVYVKVDTGMGRLGLLPGEVEGFIAKLCEMPNISIEGLITHLPDADSEDKAFARDQITTFITLIDRIRATGLSLLRNTLANSAAITDLPEGYFNQVRAGIILYGSYPSDFVNKALGLRPVMSVKSPIIAFKELPAAMTISYKREYSLSEDSVIAVLPMGYRHGYLRSLSNRAPGIYRGRRVPLAGVICMDMCMFDLGPDATPELGDEITLLGNDGDEVITVEELAEAGGTIPYELMTSLGMRSRRYFLQGSEEQPESRIEGHRLRGE